MSVLNPEQKSVGQVTADIIQKIEREKDHRATVLARLRSSIGKPLEEAGDVWPLLFENMPKQYLGRYGEETPEERAVYMTLQLYAMCMQGTSGTVISDPSFKGTIGMSLRNGRDPDDSRALDRRFNALITADTFAELAHHLRQLLKIVKSKKEMTVNFGRLADDLYRYINGKQHRVCFRWAQDYYSITDKNQTENKNEEGSSNE